MSAVATEQMERLLEAAAHFNATLHEFAAARDNTLEAIRDVRQVLEEMPSGDVLSSLEEVIHGRSVGAIYRTEMALKMITALEPICHDSEGLVGLVAVELELRRSRGDF